MPDDHTIPTPPDGRLLRAAADGELTPAEQAALDARPAAAQADDRARIEFELSLRGAVSRAMGDASASADHLASLRSAIESAWAEERSPTRRRRLFAGWTIPLAAAAALLLLVTSVIVVQQVVGLESREGLGDHYRLVSRLDREHDRCSTFGRAFESKMTTRNVDRANEAMAKVFGFGAHMPDLSSAGLTFVGLGRCTAAGYDDGVQIIYRPTSPGLGPAGAVSLFVSKDEGRSLLVPGDCVALVRAERPEEPPLLIWRSDDQELIYFLVTEREEPFEAARAALGAPTPPTVTEVVSR